MTPTATAPSPPNLLTFLIADIRGYSTFTRERGDGAAALLAQKFADLARDAVEARSGRVIELRGDEAFAVFGSVPQAVRAAVELQATFTEESRSDPVFQLPVGIGIDAGEAVPVERGYRGIAVNMAARLCSSAAAGEVLVTRTVSDLVQDADDVVFAERGRSTFKGFEEPVEVIEALAAARGVEVAPPRATGPEGETAGAGALPPELDPMTPMVDREREMRWLRGTWRQVRRGRGRVLVVSGPAQIGKTRLAAELASYVSAQGADVRYAGQGGAGTALALAAVRDAMRSEAPTLLVLDDIDVSGSDVSRLLEDRYDEIAALPVLVLALLRDEAASPELAALIGCADERGDGHHSLPPFDLEEVRGVVRLYVGDAESEAPVESFARASEGVPGRVHEVVSDWTRTEASRRLSAAAEFLAVGRERHAADLEFANNAIGLKLGRLYTVEGRDVPATGVCPYKGLAQFEADDSRSFFGRERLVGELAARTVAAGFLCVVGASGSGKSSAIAAGLIPSLDAGLLPGSERWTHLSMRPGEHPLAELRRLLGSDAEDPWTRRSHRWVDGRLVLVVDQFEETFTTCTSEDERSGFVSALTNAATRWPERVAVVAAIRGDHYGECAAYPELADLLAANHVLVGALTRDELRRAIELPARRAGLRTESALVDSLVEEVADEPGSLPLLSTALVELWRARDDGWLRMEMNEQTGGVRGAVARLAESSYAQLSDAEQAASRRVFYRLVTVGDDEMISKRRVALDEFDLEKDHAAAAVIARLTQDRLLTVGDDTVEVSHEALLREWPRLRGWLEEDREGRRLHLRLVQAATAWDTSGQEEDELLRGATLASALDWSAGHVPELNQQERAFLESSRRASELEAERQRSANRRLRGLLTGVGVFLVIALVAGSVALVQRSRARAASRAATAQRLGAQALQQDDLDLSLLLARQGVALYDSPVTDRNAALVGSPAAIRVVHPLPGLLTSAALSDDGSLFAVGNLRSEGAVIDTDTYQTVASLPGQPLAFSSDGRVFVNTPGFGTLAIVDPKTGEQHDLDRALQGPSTAQINPDFSELAMVEGSTITFWDTADVTKSGQLQARKGQAFVDAYYTREGRHLITLQQAADGTGPFSWVLRDAVTHRLEHTITTTDASVWTYAVSPDGRWIAFGFQDGTVSLANVASGHKVVMGSRHEGAVVSLAISRDDTTVVSGGDDNAIKVWDLKSGKLRETLTGHANWVASVAISPDGRTLYSVSFDGSMIVWDLQGSRRLGRPFVASSGSFQPVNGDYPPVPHLLSVSPMGGLFASSACDGNVVIQDVTTLRKISTIHAVSPVRPCTGNDNPPDSIDCELRTTLCSHRTGSAWSWGVRAGR